MLKLKRKTKRPPHCMAGLVGKGRTKKKMVELIIALVVVLASAFLVKRVMDQAEIIDEYGSALSSVLEENENLKLENLTLRGYLREQVTEPKVIQLPNTIPVVDVINRTKRTRIRLWLN